MYKLIYDVIHGPKKLDRFMHCLDVWEKGRKLGKWDRVTVDYTTEPDLEELQKTLLDAFQAAGQDVMFLSLVAIEGHPRPHVEPYIMPNVQTISTGHQWTLFKEGLEQIGYDVTTDEFMNVTSAKHKDINPVG